MHVVPGAFAIGIGAFALYALKDSKPQRTEMLGWPSVPGRITTAGADRALRSMS